MANRQRGTVKWFDPNRGYGFIKPDREGEDVFLHVSEAPTGDLTEGDRLELEEGDRLEFEVKRTDDGYNAEEVERVRHFVPKDTSPLLKKHRRNAKNLAFQVRSAAAFSGEDADFLGTFSFTDFSENRLRARYEAHLEAVRSRPGLAVETLSAAVDWRLAVGLGRASVYENGITLDHTDGFPYVPGSSVKGTLRTFLINAVYRSKIEGSSNEEEAESKALQDPEFCDLFGTPANKDAAQDQSQQGAVTFHDAYPQPTPIPRVEADVTNPHYQQYYQGTEAPTDDMNPNVITFLTVTEAQFTFAISTRENGPPRKGCLVTETPVEHTDTRLDLLRHWLERLLTEHGLGAKTAAGYGFFVLEDEMH